jgi:hypothetical protein
MRLTLTRDVFGSTATLGVLTVDGKSFGYTVEDEDRDLSQGMTDAQIKAGKVKAETAIPVGRYRVTMTFSKRFQREMPLVCDVPGFQGIRIHPGNKMIAACLARGEPVWLEIERDEAAWAARKANVR